MKSKLQVFFPSHRVSFLLPQKNVNLKIKSRIFTLSCYLDLVRYILLKYFHETYISEHRLYILIYMAYLFINLTPHFSIFLHFSASRQIITKKNTRHQHYFDVITTHNSWIFRSSATFYLQTWSTIFVKVSRTFVWVCKQHH